MPLPQNQSWRIRLAAVKVKKQALTGIMDDVSLKQTTTGQTIQSGRRFVYDESGHLAGEYDPSGKTIQEMVWLEDLPVASIRPKASGTGTEIYYIHPDHLGTPRQITDASNKIVWRWDTVEPFGNGLPDEDADGDGVRFEFNLRFPGQYYDRETGRHYNYFRDYDPETGRYTTSDPIGLRGGNNRYIYVQGNPLSSVDPRGLANGPFAHPPSSSDSSSGCVKDCPVTACHVQCVGIPAYWGVICTRMETACGKTKITDGGLFAWMWNQRGFNIYTVMSCSQFDFLRRLGPLSPLPTGNPDSPDSIYPPPA